MAIISAIVSAAARNMKQTGQGERYAEKGYNIDAIKRQQPGMQVQQMQAMKGGGSSPTANLASFTGVSPQMQKQIPIIGSALKGEEAMLQNQNIPLVGGYMLQPKFDSSRPIYSSRRFY